MHLVIILGTSIPQSTEEKERLIAPDGEFNLLTEKLSLNATHYM